MRRKLEDLLLPRRLARLEEKLAARTGSLAVALEHLHKPHNWNAVLRTCEAFGVQFVHLIPQTGQKGIVKAVTRGCDKWLTLVWHRDADSCLETLRREGFRVLAATLDKDARPLAEEDLGGKVALLFGNELAGATSGVARGADGRFVIPMRGFSQSINVSVAAGIALHLARRVKEREGRVGDLPPDLVERLRERWVRASLRRGEEIALDSPPRTP